MTHEERNALHIELMKKELADRFSQKYAGSEYFDTMLEHIESYNEKFEEQTRFSQTEFLNRTYSI